MHAFVPATLFAIAVASIGPAQAAQEFSCTGPDSLTGKAIGPTTLSVPGFECAGAPKPRAPFIVVNFKRPEPVVKTGDTVTVKGHFSVVLDPAQQMDYVIV